MLKLLFDNLKSTPYDARLSDFERDICRWWAMAILHPTTRAIRHKSGFADYIIYTDATTSTRILEAVVFQRDMISRDSGASFDFADVSDREWDGISAPTTYVLGLEMLAILATLLKI